MINTRGNGSVSDGGDGEFEWLQFPQPESSRVQEAKTFIAATDWTIGSIDRTLGEVGLSPLKLDPPSSGYLN